MVGLALNRGNRGFVTAAVQALQADDDAVVADVGFGGGVGLKLLLDSVGRSGRVHGVEVSDTMLKQAAKQYRRDVEAGRLVLHNGSLTGLPFADGTLNGVVTVNTIYFVAELQEAFAELARVTAPSGRIVVGVGDPDTMAKLPFTGHGFRLRPIPEVINALQSAGLTVQDRRDQCRRRGTPPVDRHAGTDRGLRHERLASHNETSLAHTSGSPVTHLGRLR